MVRGTMGWLGLLALLPCVFAFAYRDQEECTFVMQCETALFAFNDKTIRGINVEGCKQACLDEVEFECRSVDYIRDSESCYLSRENAFTQSVHMGPHSGADHYSYLCGEEELTSSVTEVSGYDCGFLKQCHMALFGYNTEIIDNVSLDECMKACLNETEFDCLSFDYAPESKSCYLSEQSAETQTADMGPHFAADYYHKTCPQEGSGNNA